MENRCVVPFNSFGEFNKTDGGDVWFALSELRSFACFDIYAFSLPIPRSQLSPVTVVTDAAKPRQSAAARETKVADRVGI